MAVSGSTLRARKYPTGQLFGSDEVTFSQRGISMEATNVHLRPGTIKDLATLKPLWTSVHQHHRQVMPTLSPYVTDAESWTVRKQMYERLLNRSGTICWLAFDGAAAIGYTLAYVLDNDERAWIDDTWHVKSAAGEIESLAVLPQHRGMRIGTTLLSAVHKSLSDAGVHNVVLGVLPQNLAAIRLYQKFGYQPTWLYLSRFAHLDGIERT